MTTRITDPPIDHDLEGATAKARAEILQRAEAQGIKPFTSVKDFAGNPEMTADFDVDAFLLQVREDRDLSSTQSGK